jgi:predicted ferric reductase
MIQNFTGATNTTYYWGYGSRIVPCTSDAGACAYLDVVYDGHVGSMLYSGIFWAAVSGIIFLWAMIRRLQPSSGLGSISSLEAASASVASTPSSIGRLTSAVLSSTRRYLLPNSARIFFGHTTRLQVLILFILLAYLTAATFVGMTYSIWYSPVKNQPAGVYNTRTTLGPWSDRIGVLAYALTPLSVLLASRESLLSLVTGVPYTSFMFLHRWTGYIILIQSMLHTIGWVIIEARLYQPQPTIWNTLMANQYIVWGFAALGLLVLVWLGSLQWTIRNVTGYEFFRKSHYVLAMVYIGALIGHWELLQCFLVPGLVLWAVDRLIRSLRTAMLHYLPGGKAGTLGFRSATANAQIWHDAENGDVYRLDFDHLQDPWKIGQHFFLCFPASSIWQSHPFTPLSLPMTRRDGTVRHSYIIRAKKGETKKVAEILKRQITEGVVPTTPVILQGPYGEDIACNLAPDVNVLCVAGGTGITYVLPVLSRLVLENPVRTGRNIKLVWAVRKAQDVEWVRPELDELHRLGRKHGIVIQIFVTHAEDAEASSPTTMSEKGDDAESTVSRAKETNVAGEKEAPRDSGELAGRERPDLASVVQGFVEQVAAGPTHVFGSGPPGMIGDLRSAVAGCNSGSRVWRGDRKRDVRLVCDDRMEW